jgi:ribosomal protein S18 acetylase RimI-like enzyme
VKKPDTPTIRQYQEGDRDQLYELVRNNFSEFISVGGRADTAHERAYFEHIVNIQNSGKGRVLVAADKARLLGFVCLLGPIVPTEQDDDSEPYAFMSDLYVHQSARCRGVGSSLVVGAEHLAGGMGIGKLALRVAANNDTARRFYDRHHYQEKFVVLSKEIRRIPPA